MSAGPVYPYRDRRFDGIWIQIGTTLKARVMIMPIGQSNREAMMKILEIRDVKKES